MNSSAKAKSAPCLLEAENKDDLTCRLCLEGLDELDLRHESCRCQIQICIWCWHNLIKSHNGVCPMCSQTLYHDVNFKSPDPIKIGKLQEKQKIAHVSKTRRSSTPTSPQKMHMLYIVQKNTVFLTGIPKGLTHEEFLRKTELSGKFRTFKSLLFNQPKNQKARSSDLSDFECYLTYSSIEEATKSILHFDGMCIDGVRMRASYGTTKYCHQYIKKIPCTNHECRFLHETAPDGLCFSKDDMYLQGDKADSFIELTRPHDSRNMRKSGLIDKIDLPSEHQQKPNTRNEINSSPETSSRFDIPDCEDDYNFQYNLNGSPNNHKKRVHNRGLKLFSSDSPSKDSIGNDPIYKVECDKSAMNPYGPVGREAYPTGHNIKFTSFSEPADNHWILVSNSPNIILQNPQMAPYPSMLSSYHHYDKEEEVYGNDTPDLLLDHPFFTARDMHITTFSTHYPRFRWYNDSRIWNVDCQAEWPLEYRRTSAHIPSMDQELTRSFDHEYVIQQAHNYQSNAMSTQANISNYPGSAGKFTNQSHEELFGNNVSFTRNGQFSFDIFNNSIAPSPEHGRIQIPLYPGVRLLPSQLFPDTNVNSISAPQSNQPSEYIPSFSWNYSQSQSEHKVPPKNYANAAKGDSKPSGNSLPGNTSQSPLSSKTANVKSPAVAIKPGSPGQVKVALSASTSKEKNITTGVSNSKKQAPDPAKSNTVDVLSQNQKTKTTENTKENKKEKEKEKPKDLDGKQKIEIIISTKSNITRESSKKIHEPRTEQERQRAEPESNASSQSSKENEQITPEPFSQEKQEELERKRIRKEEKKLRREKEREEKAREKEKELERELEKQKENERQRLREKEEKEEKRKREKEIQAQKEKEKLLEKEKENEAEKKKGKLYEKKEKGLAEPTLISDIKENKPVESTPTTNKPESVPPKTEGQIRQSTTHPPSHLALDKGHSAVLVEEKDATSNAKTSDTTIQSEPVSAESILSGEKESLVQSSQQTQMEPLSKNSNASQNTSDIQPECKVESRKAKKKRKRQLQQTQAPQIPEPPPFEDLDTAPEETVSAQDPATFNPLQSESTAQSRSELEDAILSSIEDTPYLNQRERELIVGDFLRIIEANELSMQHESVDYLDIMPPIDAMLSDEEVRMMFGAVGPTLLEDIEDEEDTNEESQPSGFESWSMQLQETIRSRSARGGQGKHLVLRRHSSLCVEQDVPDAELQLLRFLSSMSPEYCEDDVVVPIYTDSVVDALDDEVDIVLEDVKRIEKNLFGVIARNKTQYHVST